MPEAAEVAVATAQLGRVATGRRLLGLDVLHPRTRRHTTATALEALRGATVAGVVRHGKWIVVSFAETANLLGIHLRMSGTLRAGPVPIAVGRHVHAVLHLGRRPAASRPASHSVGPAPVPPGPTGAAGILDEECGIAFHDPRTFGELRVLDRAPRGAPDILAARSEAALELALGRRRAAVKAVLLDQQAVVSGMGSYVADEALHRAGIAPLRSAARLSVGDLRRVLDAGCDVVRASMAVGGVTLDDEGWSDLWGRAGSGRALLMVHARTQCGACGTATVSAVTAGRSARWCPSCQPG